MNTTAVLDVVDEEATKRNHEVIVDVLRQIRARSPFRIYTCIELRHTPVGTIFEHSIYGRGIVALHPNGSKYMLFQQKSGGAVQVAFVQDQEPWNHPMKLILPWEEANEDSCWTTFKNNPDIDPEAIAGWINEGGSDRLDMLIYGFDS